MTFHLKKSCITDSELYPQLFKKNYNVNINIKSVITIPSNFNDIQREIIKNAYESVNISSQRTKTNPFLIKLFAYENFHQKYG